MNVIFLVKHCGSYYEESFTMLWVVPLMNENQCNIWAYGFDHLSPVSGVGLYTWTNGMQQTQAQKSVSGAHDKNTNNENILRFEPNFRCFFSPHKI